MPRIKRPAGWESSRPLAGSSLRRNTILPPSDASVPCWRAEKALGLYHSVTITYSLARLSLLLPNYLTVRVDHSTKKTVSHRIRTAGLAVLISTLVVPNLN